MKNLVLRANGSERIGLGHIFRCLALAEMLRRDFKIRLATFAADAKVKAIISGFNLEQIDLTDNLDVLFAKDCSVVIVDGYWHSNEYIGMLKNTGSKVVEIDDIPKKEYISNVVINHAAGVDYTKSVFSAATQLLCGPSFAMLRQEFLSGEWKPVSFSVPEVVTISMGGADPSNFSMRLLRALAAIEYKNLKTVNLLIGDAYKHHSALKMEAETISAFDCKIYSGLTAKEISALLSKTSLFLCPASTTAYEACAIGTTTAVFLTAANQVHMYKGLIDSGEVADGGNLSVIKDEELTEQLDYLLNNYTKLAAGQAAQPALIDRQSGERIRKSILELCN